MTSKRVWVVLPDQLSIRIFFDAGIVEGLRERLGGAIAALFLVSREAAAEWTDRLDDVPVLFGDDLTAARGARSERAARRIDR